MEGTKFDIKILDEKKNRLEFSMNKANETFCNVLKTELLNDEHVKLATYSVRHPLIDVPKFIVETDGADPRKTVLSASGRLGKEFAKFREEATKEVK